jgi:hypothetical protein
VEAFALVLTVAVAVAGWLVSQAQARRATRRNMRINYLLDAYRRLDRASNRPLIAEISGELEAAISDVMLLGSPDQAKLAADFARAFAAEHEADAQPLLLRDSLRRELLLGELPASSYVSLRVSTQGDTASATAHVWRETTDSTRRSVESELAEVGTARYKDPEPAPGGQMPEPAPGISPSQAVATSAGQVERLLRTLLADHGSEDTSSLNMQQLASRALQSALIDAQLSDSINGLGVMRLLAAMDQDRLTPDRAAEFVTLSTAISYLIERAARTQPGALTR